MRGKLLYILVLSAAILLLSTCTFYNIVFEVTGTASDAFIWYEHGLSTETVTANLPWTFSWMGMPGNFCHISAVCAGGEKITATIYKDGTVLESSSNTSGGNNVEISCTL